MTSCTLFVGNISSQADCGFLRRLFAAYGAVRDVRIPNEAGSFRHALVEYGHIDDADCAVASLHLRYCMAPGVPIVVLFHKSSQCVSEYGHRVGAAYRDAIEHNRNPLPLPLDHFDVRIPARAPVDAPSFDIRPPVPLANTGGFGGALWGK